MNAAFLPLPALCLGLGMLTAGHGQTDPAPTGPVVTHSVAIDGPGMLTLFSPLVLEPVGATGVIDRVDGFTVIDADATFSSAFEAGFPLTLTILDGNQAGVCVQIVDFNGTTLTCDQDLSRLPLTGAAYELRHTPTVESLFAWGELSGGTGTTADALWIPTESGNYMRIYYSLGGLVGTGWRGIGMGPRDMSSTPIAPWKGVFIERRWSPALRLDFAGEAPATPLRVPLMTGFNPVSRGTLEPLTLDASRLQETLTHGTPTTADMVWNPEGNGVYTRYFWSRGGIAGVGWRRLGGGSVDRGTVPLASAFVIQRRGVPTTVMLPPSSE